MKPTTVLSGCIALACLALASACVQSGGSQCAGGQLCPPGLKCAPGGGCVLNTCGNGEVEPGERCDDGNNLAGDGCSIDCQSDEQCGNGIFDVGAGEQCDCGDDSVAGDLPQGCSNRNNDALGGLCRTDCTLHCGDGEVKGNELCDGAPPRALSCAQQGFDSGLLGCTPFCSIDIETCTFFGWREVEPGTPEDINAIWGVSADDIWAAGEAGLLLRFDGLAWSLDPSLLGGASLSGLWGVDDAVFAVGGDGRLAVYDGRTWTQQAFTGGADINGVWGSARDDVYAVGDNGLIVHYDGDKWSQVDSPINSNAPDYEAVWGTGPDHIVIVGKNGTVLRSDGTGFVVDQAPGSFDHLRDVAGTGPNDVYAVGDDGEVIHYDGTDWTRLRDPDDVAPSGTNFYSVWVGGPGQVFVSGDDGVILYHDQTHWAMLETQTAENVYDIWGASADDIHAGGDSGTMMRYRGVGWMAIDSGTSNDLSSVWGSGPTDIYATSKNGRMYHYDGVSWDRLTFVDASGDEFEDGDNLLSVWGRDGNVWAVGEDGTVLRYVGSGPNIGWEELSPPTSNALYDVFGNGPNTWFVGDSGTILSYDGTDWQDFSDAANLTLKTLRHIWGGRPGSGDTTLYAVGDDGVVLTYDGTMWHRSASIFTVSDLEGVWGTSTGDVYIIGDAGNVWHDDGQNLSGGQWTDLDPPTNHDLFAIAGNQRTAYAVGRAGTVLSLPIGPLGDSPAWQPIRSGTFERLHGVWTDGQTTVFVGENGVVRMLLETAPTDGTP